DVAHEDARARLGPQVGLPRPAAPDEIPGVGGLDLGRELRAHARADAVAADQEVGALAAAAGEMRDHFRAVLVDALEIVAEMVAPVVDRLAQQPLHPVPRRMDLRQVHLGDDASLAIEPDAPFAVDAEVAQARAALLERFEELRVGRDAGAAADQLDRRALVDVGVPSQPREERGDEETRHGAADDDGAPFAARHRLMIAAAASCRRAACRSRGFGPYAD